MAGNYYSTIEAENYITIKSKLLNYRLDPFIREEEAKKGANRGLIFPFARGLRFSALLIYAIRESLSGTDLEVNWGQIIDDEGFACSGECDIIIHKKGHFKKWNGDGGKDPIMDFRFIKKSHALTVISCKSYLTKSDIEEVYCKNLLQYVKKIWLFAECCGPESIDLIRERASEIGYEFFWYIYTWSRNSGEPPNNIDGWLHFIETVKSLA